MHASREDRSTGAPYHADAILWEADPVTLQFTYVSPEAEELFGYPLERWLTDANIWIDLLHPLDRDRAVGECRAAIDAALDHVLEYRVRTARGRVVWIRDLVRVIVDDSGRPRALHGAMIDVTDRRLLLDQVLYAHRVQGIGQLTRAVAPAPDEVVDVNAELRAMEGLLRQLIGVHVQLEMTLGARAGMVRLARAVLEPIVLTLVLNARDAMPAGGTLRIITFDVAHVARAGIPETPAQVVLEVEDTGTGMPRDVRERLFEPYFTTKGTKGSGMGLSMVDRFVGEAGGRVEWSTYIGQGTRFRLFLPAVVR
jgi:PAS domain S-box-containing protein